MPAQTEPVSAVVRNVLLPVLLAFAVALPMWGQTSTPGALPGDQDAGIVTGAPQVPQTPAELREAAWTLLTNAANTARSPDLNIQALAALGLLDGNARSLKLIEQAMVDHDVDVRTAAALAAGQTGSPSITTSLRRMLDDKEPQVAFGAATALWKLGDQSGEDILMAVADGERSASASILNDAAHTVNRDLHHPSTLAKMGALQGAGMLLGPFGYGITAYEYLHKNGGDSARVSAIELLAQNHTGPIRTELLSALGDRDPGVRATAAKALAGYHDPQVASALTALFDDPKPPVRLTAAAAYLITSGAVPQSPAPTAQPRSRQTRGRTASSSRSASRSSSRRAMP